MAEKNEQMIERFENILGLKKGEVKRNWNILMKTGFGIDSYDAKILQLLDVKRKIKKYQSQLFRDLIFSYPNEKWNQTTLRNKLKNLSDIGVIDLINENKKIYVRLSKLGVNYLKMLLKFK